MNVLIQQTLSFFPPFQKQQPNFTIQLHLMKINTEEIQFVVELEVKYVKIAGYS